MPTSPRIARLMCRLSNSPPAYCRSIGKLKDMMPRVSSRVTRMADDHRTHSRRSMRRMPTRMLLCSGSFIFFIVNRPQYLRVLYRPHPAGLMLSLPRKSTHFPGLVCKRLRDSSLADSWNRKASQEAHRACVIRKPFFVVAEQRRVRFPAAAHEADGVLYVEHFVEQDVSDYVRRNSFVVQLAIQNDLIQGRVEAAQLGSPDAPAPPQPRPRKGTLKIRLVQLVKQRLQIVVGAHGTMLHAARPATAIDRDSLPGGSRRRKKSVDFQQIGGRASPIQASQKDGSDRFDGEVRRAAHHVGEPHVGRVLAQPDRVGEVRVGMIFDHELRRAPRATQARIDALKNPLAAGNRTSGPLRRAARLSHCFRLTGGACDSFSASVMSSSASFVPAIASSSVSR